ncbi:MAG TPA: alpha/beta hydrolase [Candidatus Limiplasma sp.]|nr:alpha/beta hydrolase [Candidatus Limiplasma sp.]HPS80842.1 alpha/beta hydrolase [Candidatus Limiplasma sp.]
MMEFDQYGDPRLHTVVMLHGAAATDTFANQYVLSEKYHLVIPHLSGAGRAVASPYDPKREVEALTELIRSLGKEKVSLIGHSLGGELAVALVTEHPELFDRAAFLSAWVCSTPKSIRLYARLARGTYFMLRWSWLIRLQGKYWGYTDAQAAEMARYSALIPRETYVAWFQKRVVLDELPGYAGVTIPMIAVCGERETREMKQSIAELGRRNPHCQTIRLRGASHDFPMRKVKEVNELLQHFLEA